MSATGGEVEAAAPDEGPDRLEECHAEAEVAGHRTGLDHGGAFPVLTHALVVGDGGGQGDGGRRHRGIGAQAQVGAEHVAIGVTRLHQRHQAAGDPRGEAAHRVVLGAFGVYWRRRIVEQHEVHIGRIVQFTGTELAHAEYREPPAAARIAWIRQSQVARVMRGTQEVRHGERQGGFGQIAQCRGDAFQRPDAADVRDGGGQGDHPLGAAQGGGDAVAAGLRHDGRQFVQRRRDHRIRSVGDQGAQAGGFAHREIGEIRAVAAERTQQRDHRRPGCEARLGAAQRGEALDQPLRRASVMRLRPTCRQAERCAGHSRESWA